MRAQPKAAPLPRPSWLMEAEANIGLREIPGAPTAPAITRWLVELGAWWKGDEVPWCGTFVAHCMKTAAIEPPAAWYRAKAWASWGQPIDQPIFGCVVVFERAGGGHVGFAVGRQGGGRILVLGGNQGDAVRVASFDPERIIASRWPDDRSMSVVALPLGYAPASTSEA